MNYIKSLEKTLPLNIQMNQAFGNKQVGDLLDVDNLVEIIEVVPAVAKQIKLIFDEMDETVAAETVSELLDGIGDIITTVDGYMGLYMGVKFEGDTASTPNLSFEEIGHIGWDTQGIAESSDHFYGIVQNINSLITSDAAELYGLRAALLSFSDVYQNPKFQGGMNGLLASYYSLFERLEIGMIHIRASVHSLAEQGGWCSVKILEEVWRSNMSKLCTSYEKAQETVASYVERGIPEDCLVIEESTVEGSYAVKIAKEVDYKNQVLPVGKFMKSVDYKEPDFSDPSKFEIDSED